MEPDADVTESLHPRASGGGSLPVGSLVLDKYRVEREIGRGGMGEVYEATHTTLGSRVALKLPLSSNESTSAAARLLREAQVAASLDPDRVVRVLDVGVMGDGRPVLVLELLEGESLAEHIVRLRPTTADAVDYAIGVCLGLSLAHARGIIHRDIKPSNVFLARRRDGTSVVKVLDFGVAALRGALETDVRLTSSQSPIGSPPYMAPEQIRGLSVDARTDVWGLGVLLFELLSGRRPFEGPNPGAIGAAIVADPPASLRRLLPGLPAPLYDVVDACLDKEPARRPASVLELADSLAIHASPQVRAELARARSAGDRDASASPRVVVRDASNPTTRGASTADRISEVPKRTPFAVMLGAAAAIGIIGWSISQRESLSPTSGSSASAAESGVNTAAASSPSEPMPAPPGARPHSATIEVSASASSAPSATSASTGMPSSLPTPVNARRQPAPAPTAVATTLPAVKPPSNIMDERKF